MKRKLACCSILWFAAVIGLNAQSDTGQISGVVTDASGALIADATITVKRLGTDATRTEHTTGSGSYLVIGLEPGNYEVTVQTEGFKSFVGQLQVTVGGHSTLDAKLALGAGSAEVEVFAEGGAEVNTTTQELSQVVDRQEISQLPSLTRNPYDFVVLSGNVFGGDNTAAGMSENVDLRGSTTTSTGSVPPAQKSFWTALKISRSSAMAWARKFRSMPCKSFGL